MADTVLNPVRGGGSAALDKTDKVPVFPRHQCSGDSQTTARFCYYRLW